MDSPNQLIKILDEEDNRREKIFKIVLLLILALTIVMWLIEYYYSSTSDILREGVVIFCIFLSIFTFIFSLLLIKVEPMALYDNGIMTRTPYFINKLTKKRKFYHFKDISKVDILNTGLKSRIFIDTKPNNRVGLPVKISSDAFLIKSSYQKFNEKNSFQFKKRYDYLKEEST